MPDAFVVNDNMIIPPLEDGSQRRGRARPQHQAAAHCADRWTIRSRAAAAGTGDNITTDHIMPAGAQVLPLALQRACAERIRLCARRPDFPRSARARRAAAFVVGGENYGQGSSREHAALVPMYLGVGP